ncbi:MAG: hypothetical protein AAB629_00050 [Patescibacteria group bacterium]
MLICIAIITAIALLQPRVAVKTTGVDTTEQISVVESVQTETMAPVAREITTNQNDGSVIVRDKGASFTMMPASSKQPAVVTEQEVRNRTNRMPQQ